MSEVAFAPYYFDITPAAAAEYLCRYAEGPRGVRETATLDGYKALVDDAGRCLDQLAASVPWERYDIVGFSVMMQQTVPSLALARRIKTHQPNMRVVFGGPNCSSPMGAEILRYFPEVDYVLEGEADETIAPMVAEIRASPDGPYGVPGLYYRDSRHRVRQTLPPRPFFGLDSLPPPDYGPFFEQIEALSLNALRPYLQLETSRGCWWGEKHHCSFCSIEDSLMKFRSKSEDKVIEEVLTLSERHQYNDFFSTDSILSHRFYETLLPRLAELQQSTGYVLRFFFEAKSNMRREHVRRLKLAGVNQVQVGLESLSDNVLRLMDKGSTGIRQLQCLKLLNEAEIRVIWNVIYQNPGETSEDYRQIIDMLPFMYHLAPLEKDALIPMQLMRFSPYFQFPARYGIANVRPMEFYEYLYADPNIDLDKLACYFDYDHEILKNPNLQKLYAELATALDTWRECYRPNTLVQRRGPGFLIIEDQRVFPVSPGHLRDPEDQTLVLEDIEAEMFSFCDEIRSETEMLRAFGGRVSAQTIRNFLEAMHNRRFLYRSSFGHVVNLPLLRT